MANQDAGVDAAQVEALAARQNRDRNFADFGRCKDEFHMGRRFFQCLQQAVEGLIGEHVHFIDDVDLVTRRNRAITHLFDDLANIVDTRMRGGVHFDHVDMAAFHDRLAMLARHGEIDCRFIDLDCLVVKRARQNSRGRRLADTAHAGQHPRLRDAPGFERIGQRANHRLLADQIVKILRAIFAGEHAIGAICHFGVHRVEFRSCINFSRASQVWTAMHRSVNAA